MSTKTIYIIGEIGRSVTLQSVKNQVSGGAYDRVLLSIHSSGGSVSESLAIYDYLNNLGVPIDTHIEGVCYSAAVHVALIGENRTANEHAFICFHNPSIGFFMQNLEAKDLSSHANTLEKTKNTILDIYAKKITKLSRDEISNMMDGETYLDVKQAYDLGVITALPKQTENSNKELHTILNHFSKMNTHQLRSALASIQNGLTGLVKTGIKNLIVQDANGQEIDFYELDAGATPKVGDLAKINGVEAEGEVTTPSGDIYVFLKGQLAEIKKADDETAKENTKLKEEVQAFMEENKMLKAEQEKMKMTIGDIRAQFEEVKNYIGSSFHYEQPANAQSSLGNPQPTEINRAAKFLEKYK